MLPLPCFALLVVAACHALPDLSSSPWLDPALPVDARVAALLAQMTNLEKQAQTIHLTGGALPDVIKAYAATGLGAFPSAGGSVAQLNNRNYLQGALMNNSRLHIPVSFHQETLHGGCENCVIFPMPASQGASWSAPLVRDIARAVAVEAWASGIDRGFSPELNVPTDPRFGRSEENFSEEPALVAAMGVAAVLGLHAGNSEGPSSYLPPFAIVSEAKHAAAYAWGGKDGAGADLSERTLHDVYLRPWAAYAAAGGRAAMMAHNSINQVPCHSSAPLMGWLRQQGNFSGAFLASDMCDVGLLARGFRTATGLQDAAAQAMGSGLDQELCNPDDGRGMAFPLAVAAVEAGALPQAALDRAAGNVLRAKFAAGLFDGRAFVDASNLPLIATPAHVALARAAAAEGSVLLRNTAGLLPLRLSPAAPTRVAIVGPLAGCAGGGGAACDAALSQCGGYTNHGINVTTVLDAAREEPGVVVTGYTRGCEVGGGDESGFAAAVAAALAADVVVAVVGDSGGQGWNMNTCGEDDDRAELELPGVQGGLIAALNATGKPLVVVLIHGRPVTFAARGWPDTVLAAWRPGSEGGRGIWDLLSGRQSPSGRLAQAWVQRVGQVHSEASPWFSTIRGDFDRVACECGGGRADRGRAHSLSLCLTLTPARRR